MRVLITNDDGVSSRGLTAAGLEAFGTLPDTVDRSVRQILFAHMEDGQEPQARFPEGTDAHELSEAELSTLDDASVTLGAGSSR